MTNSFLTRRASVLPLKIGKLVQSCKKKRVWTYEAVGKVRQDICARAHGAGMEERHLAPARPAPLVAALGHPLVVRRMHPLHELRNLIIIVDIGKIGRAHV